MKPEENIHDIVRFSSLEGFLAFDRETPANVDPLRKFFPIGQGVTLSNFRDQNDNDRLYYVVYFDFERDEPLISPTSYEYKIYNLAMTPEEYVDNMKNNVNNFREKIFIVPSECIIVSVPCYIYTQKAFVKPEVRCMINNLEGIPYLSKKKKAMLKHLDASQYSESDLQRMPQEAMGTYTCPNPYALYGNQIICPIGGGKTSTEGINITDLNIRVFYRK
jgi:hypothetical protein